MMTVLAETTMHRAPPYELLPLVIMLLLVIVRIRLRVLRPWRMVIGPVILIVLGCAVTVPVLAHGALTGRLDVVVVAADVALSLGLGVIRGATVLIGTRDDKVAVRYGAATVALWVASILARGGFGAFAHAHGASAWASSDDVLAMLGVSLLVQNVLVIHRARARSRRRESVSSSARSSTLGC